MHSSIALLLSMVSLFESYPLTRRSGLVTLLYPCQQFLAVATLMPDQPGDAQQRYQPDEPTQPSGHGTRCCHRDREAGLTLSLWSVELDHNIPGPTHRHANTANQCSSLTNGRQLRA